MLLLLDIGNTRAKLVVMHQDNIVCHRHSSHAQLIDSVEELLRQWTAVERIVWCSVSADIDGWEAYLAHHRLLTQRFLPTLPIAGITLHYLTPSTLGADRLAAVLGARAVMPGRDLLVVDAGTCITYDLLTADGHHLGGNISPGVDLRLRALHDYTGKLPLVKAEGETRLVSISTEMALRSGVVLGVRLEVEAYIARLREEYPQLCVFLTGGTDLGFDISEESCTFADDFLVAKGLALFARL